MVCIIVHARCICRKINKRKITRFYFETEEQVEKHLDQYTDKLPKNDKKSREILLEIKKDETKHKETARELGSTKLVLKLGILCLFHQE